MKVITIFIFLFIFFISNFAIAKIEDCTIIKDELKKKNCVINNKAEKLKNKIKEKSSNIYNSEIKPTLEKHEKFQKESPKTLWDLFKKIKKE